MVEVFLLLISNRLGMNTSQITVSPEFFSLLPTINQWRFEVVYGLKYQMSRSAFDVKLNDKPNSGFCTISPPNGTIETLFTINCSNWIDSDGIESYSISGWWQRPSERTFFLISDASINDFLLPANVFPVNLIVSIRDRFDAVIDVNLSPVFVSNAENSSIEILKYLTTGNLNRICQTILSISDRTTSNCNENENFNVVQSHLCFDLDLNTSVTPLISSTNSTAMPNGFRAELNRHASLREFLLDSLLSFGLPTRENLLLQSSTLVHFVSMPNELTRQTIVRHFVFFCLFRFVEFRFFFSFRV